MAAEIKYPIGIQSFEKLRTQGFVYIDKTAMIYELANSSNYVFLSRPRRFGKSLLMSTLEWYFKGRRDLFEGLAIAGLEKDWEEYPVFHFDFNTGCYGREGGLADLLNNQICRYEEVYGRNPDSDAIPDRFGWLLRRAYEQTGRKSVVLIDEYDKPMLSTGDSELEAHFRSVLKPFYGNLKSMDGYIRFAMLTGVTRFSKLSIFSDLNNLKDISLNEKYSTICGITEREMLDTFGARIVDFARKLGEDETGVIGRLRRKYDGYRFSEGNELVYNPFSLLNSLDDLSLRDYWFETGTPTFLIRLLKSRNYNLSSLEGKLVQESTLVDFENENPVTVLYQSGYLTIKGYDPETSMYTLGFPNQEVESAFIYCLLPNYSGLDRDDGKVEILELTDLLRTGEVDTFMERLLSIFADVPYTTETGAKMQELQFQNLVYLLFKLIGLQVRVEQRVSRGRIDAVVHTRERIYVIEFKVDSTAEAAIEQIVSRGYATPFLGDGREVVLLGVNYSTSERNISSWKTQTLT